MKSGREVVNEQCRREEEDRNEEEMMKRGLKV